MVRNWLQTSVCELALSLLGTVHQTDESDVIEERHGQKGELDTAIAGGYCDSADHQIDDDADGVLDAEGVQVGRAFETGVDDIGEKGGSEKTKEPFAPRDEVVLVVGIVLKVGRKE